MFSKTPGRGRGRTLRRFPSGQGEGGGHGRGGQAAEGSGVLAGPRFVLRFPREGDVSCPPSCPTALVRVRAQLRWSGRFEETVPAEGPILPPPASAGELCRGPRCCFLPAEAQPRGPKALLLLEDFSCSVTPWVEGRPSVLGWLRCRACTSALRSFSALPWAAPAGLGGDKVQARRCGEML